MKKLLITLLGLLAVGVNAATFEYDMKKGIDLTAQSSVTAAQLNQLIDGATPYPGKGLVIRQAIHPNVTGNPRYTNFIWFDLVTQTLKSYHGVGDDATNWVAATLGLGTIGTANIAGSAITDALLAPNAVNTTNLQNNAVTSDKIGAGQVLNSQLGLGSVSNANIASGTITGDRISTQTILNTNLAEGNITGGKLQSATITGDKIAALTIANTNLATNTVGSQNIMAGAVGGAQLGNGSVSTNHISITGASSYQNMAVDPSGSFARWTTPIFSQGTNISGGAFITNTPCGFTNAHGLGSMPTMVFVAMTNNATDLNYQPGDQVPIANAWDAASGVTVSYDAVNVYVIFQGALPVVENRSMNSASGRITTGKWGLKITAYK